METIENMPIAARHIVCMILAALIVTGALMLGTFGVNAELNSAQHAVVSVEVA